MNNFHFIRLALSNIYRVSEYTVDDALMDQAIRIHIFDLGPVQTSYFCRAELNSGIKFDKSTAEARRLNQTFELSSASN